MYAVSFRDSRFPVNIQTLVTLVFSLRINVYLQEVLDGLDYKCKFIKNVNATKTEIYIVKVVWIELTNLRN
jgi:hypothetical protein